MAKNTIKSECLVQNNRKNGSDVTFIVEKEQPKKNSTAAITGGSTINARIVINASFDDDSAKQYAPGKKYIITIEESK